MQKNIRGSGERRIKVSLHKKEEARQTGPLLFSFFPSLVLTRSGDTGMFSDPKKRNTLKKRTYNRR
jgi:hypothetical protein